MKIDLTPADIARFTRFISRPTSTGCVLWLGCLTSDGYGSFRLGYGTALAHRIAFVLGGGVLTPEKPDVLHNCPFGDNPTCCEFSHLWAGTRRDNNLDKSRKYRGNKSRRGLPYGVSVQRNGRFASQITFNGRRLYMGTFDTMAEASAMALYRKNLVLAGES